MLCHFIFFFSFSHNFFHIYISRNVVDWVITISSHYDALRAFVSRSRWILFNGCSVLLQFLWSFFRDSFLLFFNFFFNVLYLSFYGVDLHRYALGFFERGFFVVCSCLIVLRRFNIIRRWFLDGFKLQMLNIHG
jgi:hypothetical protein